MQSKWPFMWCCVHWVKAFFLPCKKPLEHVGLKHSQINFSEKQRHVPVNPHASDQGLHYSSGKKGSLIFRHSEPDLPGEPISIPKINSFAPLWIISTRWFRYDFKRRNRYGSVRGYPDTRSGLKQPCWGKTTYGNSDVAKLRLIKLEFPGNPVNIYLVEFLR